MAKWKNALLISTIVAPIAFGASPIGNVLAATNPDYTDRLTDVTVHKYLNTKGANNQNYYWGNGSELSDPSTVFGSADGWTKATTQQYTFTAYSLPGDVIKGFGAGDEPTINNVTFTDDEKSKYPTLTSLNWKGILQAIQPAQGTDYQKSTGNGDKFKSTWTIQIIPSLLSNTTLMNELQAYLGDNQATYAGDEDTNAAGYQVKTSNGDATFQDLPNNEWIIFETNAPNGISKAVPMVLNLPAIQTAGDPSTDAGWFGSLKTAASNVGEPALHLYPKDYTEAPSLKVVKTDGNTNQAIPDAKFVLFDAKKYATAVTNLNDDIAAGQLYDLSGATYAKSTATTPDPDNDILAFSALSNEQVIKVLTDIYGVAAGDIDEAKTDSNGIATFDSKKLAVGGSYAVLETEAPSDYDEVMGVRTITLSVDTAQDDTVVDENSDDTIYFTGGQYNLKNFPGTDVDKNINVQNPVPLDQLGTATDADKFQVFENNDWQIGVSRGENFQYTVDAEFNQALDDKYTSSNKHGYEVFKVTDEFDHEIDIPTFAIGVWDGTTYTTLATAKADALVDDGGFSGKLESLDYELTITAAGLAQGLTQEDIDNYITVSATPVAYNMAGGTLAAGSHGGTITVSLNSSQHTESIGGKNYTITDLGENKVAQVMTKLTAGKSDSQMRLLMNATTNSSATVGEIDNKAQVTSKPVFDTPDLPDDSSTTFNSGWEFIKTDGSDTPIEDAGFILKRDLSSADDFTQQDRLLNNDSRIAAFIDPDTDDLTADAVKALTAMAKYLYQNSTAENNYQDWWVNAPADSGLDKAQRALSTSFASIDDVADIPESDTDLANELYDLLQAQSDGLQAGNSLYFAHLNSDGLPQHEMKQTGEMGDVLWTLYPEFATTHYTNDVGYLQYCGLASGPYTLVENVLPSGYEKIDDIKFYLANQELMDYTGTDTDKLAAKAEQATAIANAEQDGFELLLGQGSDKQISGAPADGGAAIEMIKNDQAVQIKNYQKSIFPLVGGIGAMFAVIAGLLAMGLALLKRKKDMKNEA